METISFKDLVTGGNALVWPDGSPENLTGAIRQFYADALVDLQRWIDCLQDSHVDVFPHAATYFKCGLSIFDAPRGRLRKVTVVQSTAGIDNYCDPIRYGQRSLDEINCWSRRFMDLSLVTAPVNDGMPALPLGFKYPEASTDSLWGRALRGLWAVDRGRMFIAPWLQSNESVMVEWDGLKRKYMDTDLVPDDDDLKRAIRLFVQKEFARDFDKDMVSAVGYAKEYHELRADLMWECQEERKQRQETACAAEAYAVSVTQSDDDVEELEAAATTLFGVIGDYGLAGTPADDVAALVKGWGPEFILTTGDNNYPSGEAATIDANIGKNWRSFIYPYLGSQPLGSGESDATENKFWPVLGNHDLDNAGTPGQPYLDYFTLGNANERYYDFVWGHCHFFMLNSGLKTDGTQTEPDGAHSFSMQSEWLLLRMLQSTARWKIVAFHHPPFTSRPGYYPGTVDMRWNFRVMGAHVVLNGHGHSYERIEMDGLPYLVNGAGGNALVPFDETIVSGSQLRYDADYGAIKGKATCNALTLEFWTRTGLLIDTLTLT